MMFWTLDRLAHALRDELQPSARIAGTAPMGGVSTDTRSIARGDVFVALRGERFDGHDFLAQATTAGASAVVVDDASRAAGLGVPTFVVADTTQALGALGRWWRATWGGTVVAVAGSNGKTTTKELIRAALGTKLDVYATTGNLNNQVGVPLTLLRLPSTAAIAVIEVGTSVPGEVEILRRIVEPNISVVTSIGEEHLEGLGSLEGVLNEEAAIYDRVELAIAPASQPEIGDAARKRARNVVEAGVDAGDVRPEAWGMNPEGTGWARFGDATLTMKVPGAHNLRNAMLAMAVSRACGVPDESAISGIGSVEPLDMRGRWLASGDLTIINDAYNANPASMREAITLLDSLNGSRPRVLVLGTMRELGPQAPALHDEIAARALSSGVDVVAGIGDFVSPLASRTAKGKEVLTAPDVPELWESLRPRLPRNAIVMLKASRGVRLERLVPLLQEWSTGRAPSPLSPLPSH
jgi:UDP-N-acetylmuramoyl-tripeptide--D-alanyl-D-alanine ligase